MPSPFVCYRTTPKDTGELDSAKDTSKTGAETAPYEYFNRSTRARFWQDTREFTAPVISFKRHLDCIYVTFLMRQLVQC